MKYDRGLLLNLGYGGDCVKSNNDNTVESYQNVEYLLNGKYKNFYATLICTEGGGNYQNSLVKIYGDGNLLYTSPPITSGTKPLTVDIDVSKYKILKFNLSVQNLHQENRYSYSSTRIGIIDARLEKSTNNNKPLMTEKSIIRGNFYALKSLFMRSLVLIYIVSEKLNRSVYADGIAVESHIVICNIAPTS